MKLRLLSEIAFTLLRARLRQTTVAAVGVTFGITMFITLLSFMNGLNGMLDSLVGNRTPHIRLFNEMEPNAKQALRLLDTIHSYPFIESIKATQSRQAIYNAGKILQALHEDPRILGVSRKVSTQVFFNSGPVEITGMMNGIDVYPEMEFYFFKDYITQGNATDIQHVSNSIILGKPLAEKLMAHLGDQIQITTIQGDHFPMKVVGFYQSGLADFDKTQSFVRVDVLQKIMGRNNNYITDIQIKLKDKNKAPEMAREYAHNFGCHAEDIQTANAQFKTSNDVRNIITYAVGITLLIVAGFGIYNILNMMIYEKMDTIAILKASGFSGSDVRIIFLLISLSIGIVGCIAGLLLGNVFSHLVNHIPFNSPAIPTMKTFPVDYNPAYYIIAWIFSIITTYFAGFFPARKASKIDPVVIIRGK